MCNATIELPDPESLLDIVGDEEEEKDSPKDENGTEASSGLADIQPINGFPAISDEKRKNNPKLPQLEAEYDELVELNRLKNRQLKEIIDRLRKVVWDINTMLAMRKP